MRVLIDTNILLDIMLERQPFVEPATRLLETARETNVVMYVTATTITDLYYVIRKAKGRDIAWKFVEDLMQLMEVAGVDKAVIKQALQSDLTDFEDAIQESAAKSQAIQVIVTRNEADFHDSELGIHNPESFVTSLQT